VTFGANPHTIAATPHTTFSLLNAFTADFVPAQKEPEQEMHAAAAVHSQQHGSALSDVLLDTGSSHNMMVSAVQLQDVRQLHGAAIRTAGKQVLNNPFVGQLQLPSSSSAPPLQLTNVLQHPGLSRSLLSISNLVDRPDVEKCEFYKHGAALIATNGDIVLTGSRQGGLYILDQPSANAATLAEQIQIHSKLGHIGRTMLHKLIHSGAVKGIEHLKLSQELACDSCKEGKATQLRFMQHTPQQYLATRSLQRIHVDLQGPMKQPSLSGALYVLVVVDEYSDSVWAIPIKSKDQAAKEIKKLVKQVHSMYGVYPANIHSDRGGEFLGGDLLDFYDECGIKATQTPAYTPQLNGRAERMNRTLVERARTMMIAAKAPKPLWGEAIATAAVLHNRLKAHGDGSTPLQRLTGKRIVTDLDSLHEWGCTAFAAVPPQLHQEKYDPTGVKMTFVGYQDPVGYRLLPITGIDKVVITRHVKFSDGDFSAMASVREVLQEAEREDESAEWLEQAIWSNDLKRAQELSQREAEQRAQAQAQQVAEQPAPAPAQLHAPRPLRPLRPSQRSPDWIPPQAESPSLVTPSPATSESASGSEYSDSGAKQRQTSSSKEERTSSDPLEHSTDSRCHAIRHGGSSRHRLSVRRHPSLPCVLPSSRPHRRAATTNRSDYGR